MQVVLLNIKPVEPFDLAVCGEVRLCGFGELEIVGGVAALEGGVFVKPGQALDGVLAQGFEHLEGDELVICRHLPDEALFLEAVEVLRPDDGIGGFDGELPAKNP